jgi:hypothetical protein
MNIYNVYYTDHYINKTVTQFFAKSQKSDFIKLSNYQKSSDMIFVSYGILRGTAEIFLKNKNFIYIDHGYLGATQRKFLSDKSTTIVNNLEGYFRLVFNDFYFNSNNDSLSKERFKNLNIELKELNHKGRYIIISEPSEHTKSFLNIPNWTNDTINEIKKYTDREIIVHNKFSLVPLDQALDNAFAFVSCQSTAAFKAISKGVPAYFTHKNFSKYGEIKNIEDRILKYDLLYIAANNQWKLNEFFSDDFSFFLSNIIPK